MQLLQEPILQHQLGFQIIQLRHTQRRRLPHIWVIVPQAFLQRIAQIVNYLLDAYAPHGPDSERADERVRVVRVFDEGVDGKNDEFGLGFGIIDEVEVDELFLFDVVGLHIFEHVREETADIYAKGSVQMSIIPSHGGQKRR